MTRDVSELPFTMVDNRQCITAKQLIETPWLAHFMENFRHCFERDERFDVYWYYPDQENGPLIDKARKLADAGP